MGSRRRPCRRNQVRTSRGRKGGGRRGRGCRFRLTEPPERPSLLTRLRAYFLTGVIVTAPIGITVFLVWQFISFLDDQVEKLLPAQYNPETYLPFTLPGLGLLITLAFLTLVGCRPPASPGGR